MTALLDVLAGTARLSRRDRAALTLALESCRRRRGRGHGDRRFGLVAVTEAVSAMCQGDGSGACSEIADAAMVQIDQHQAGDRLSGRTARIRLALVLRLVLRCDAWTRADEDWTNDWPAGGDPRATRVRCSRCGERVHGYAVGERVEGKCPGARAERVMALWEQAPATRAR